jgi:hypothetical protein
LDFIPSLCRLRLDILKFKNIAKNEAEVVSWAEIKKLTCYCALIHREVQYIIQR